MMVALMLAPAVGGLVAGAFGWRMVFAFSAGLGALALAGVVLGYAETCPARDPAATRWRPLVRHYGELLVDRRYMAFAAALGCTYGALFVFVTGSSFVLITRHGLSQSQYGLAFGAVLAGLVAGTLAARTLVPTLGPARLVRIGSAMVLSGALLALAGLAAPFPAVAALLVPQVVITFGSGLVLPSAVAGAVMPFGHRAGLAAGFLGFIQMATAAAFGLMLGALHTGSPGWMLGVQAIAAALAFALFRWLMPSPLARPI
jgi:DHA1 family bicyclomycin/chloramphenicol resistance-like MFS transporter